jgi:UPF0755 protein
MEPKRPIQDIKRPAASQPVSANTPKTQMAPSVSQASLSSIDMQTVSTDSAPVERNHKKRSIIKRIIVSLVVVIVLVGAALTAGYMWFTEQLKPVNSSNTQKQLVVVKEGSTIKQVGTSLKSAGLIRDENVFNLYSQSKKISVHAGVYLIGPDTSVQQILKKIGSGDVDSFNLTLLPGATLADTKEALLKADFKEDDIDRAFKATYDSPLLAAKPKNASLEGFIYGDTYNFTLDATPETVLERTFDEMYAYIQKENLESAYKARGMTLYEGIIFASIIQKEVANKEDMAHVSQVFHKRLNDGMQLGSDVTFLYGAKLLGVTPTVDLDSPYNTRVHTGLPPTPIANPGAAALYAVAHPSNTDDLFFVAGDDGVTYFSKTNEEHERLTQLHCDKNCEIPVN